MKNKLGLALSGGGFRASLFHIGVLSALADLGILRSIEVISCVSGGSIIGAYYYMHIKRLLEDNKDGEITNEQYISIVKSLTDSFLEGVQKNIRVREYSHFFKNINMIRQRYSNSDRIAELYDKMFYNRFANGSRLAMKDLIIHPKNAAESFDIREDNKTRVNKVPMLILNSSTLNTGRNWQFTAVDMGERELDVSYEAFDKDFLFKSFKYTDTTISGEKYEKYRNLPLSIAVAASAGVPGIFSPLALTKLYPNSVPMLVDGGVYDNQGLASIFYEKCTDVIISDASNQLNFVRTVGEDIFSVLKRTNSDQMNRIRNQGLESIIINNKAGFINKAVIIHLMEDIEPEYLEPGGTIPLAHKAVGPKTYYGIDRNIQLQLARTRTDLDSFSDIEAYSLMYSGYKMSISKVLTLYDNEFNDPSKNRKENKTSNWKFLSIKDYCEGSLSSSNYDEQMAIASKTFFKAFRLNPKLYIILLLILLISVLPLGIAVTLLLKFIDSRLILLSFGCTILLYFIPWTVRLITKRQIPYINILKIFFSFILSSVISIGLTLYVKWINPFYIRKGSINKLK
jgi:NTE family protein